MNLNKSSGAFEDAFEGVHQLLRARKAGRALLLLIDPDSQSLRSKFAEYKNHAWYCVGNAHYMRDEFALAKAAYRRALRADPDDAQALLAVGNCYSAMHRPKLAERTLRSALEKASRGKDVASIQYNLGNALFDQGRFAEAREHYVSVSRRRDAIGRLARINCKLTDSKAREGSRLTH